MAKYEIVHSCGHKKTVNLIGKIDTRQSKADWLATQPCFACSQAAINQEAAKTTADLPELNGSDKQIIWGITLRAAVLDTFLKMSKSKKARDHACKFFAENTSAKFFIDHRGDMPNVWFNLIMKEGI